MKTNDLLYYYQKELEFIKKLGAEFAQAHPKIASRLRLNDNFIEDPHIERLIEAFALGNARIRSKLEEDFHEISDALLETLYPNYLAPIPSMSIAHFQSDKTRHTHKKLISAKTLLTAEMNDQERCYFATCYPVELAPIEITDVKILIKPSPISDAPLLTDSVAALKLSIHCTQNKLSFSELDINTIRFYINAPSSTAYALYESLVAQVTHILISDSSSPSKAISIDKSHLQPVGFTPDTQLLPKNARVPLAYQLLAEFFSFPMKFLFLELQGLQPILKHFTLAGQTLEIYFYLKKLPPAFSANLDKDYFLLFCTPIINLFEKSAEPFELTQTEFEYHLIADSQKPLSHIEVYSVKNLSGINANGQEIKFQPFYGLNHFDKHHYYIARRKPSWEGEHYVQEGYETYLSFINLEGNDEQNNYIITAQIYCTNRNLPTLLSVGSSSTYLKLEQPSDIINQIKCLTRMTATQRFSTKSGRRWRYISHLLLNHLSLIENDTGIEALKEILRLHIHDENDEGEHLLNGLLAVEAQPATCRNPNFKQGNLLWQGIRITLTLDESKYIGSSLYLFCSILDHFFGLYTTINSFTQLIVCTPNQGEIYRFKPRAGLHTLI